MDAFEVHVVGEDDAAAAIAGAGWRVQSRAPAVVLHYGQLYQTRVRAAASGRPGPNVITGDYRRSITLESAIVDGMPSAIVGTAAPQGRRLEYGFVGVDSLGRHFCVDETSEALTAQGWRSHDALDVGDEVLALDPETWLPVWQPILAVHRFPGPHEAIHINARTLSALTTADHRWLVERYYARGRRWIREWRTTATMTGNARVPLVAKPAPRATVRTLDDDLVEFVAWFWTEGSYAWSYQARQGSPRVATDRPIGVTISQSPIANPANHDRIARLLTRMFGPSGRFAAGAHWRESRNTVTGTAVFHLDRIAPWLLERAVSAPDKVLRPDFLCTLTADQLALLVEVSILADGCVDTNGVTRLGQAHEGRIRSFEMACAMAGQATSTRHVATDTGEMWLTTLLRRPWSHGFGSALRTDRDHAQVERLTHPGLMWCPTTSAGTWLCRRNGKVYFTGNSQPPYPHFDPPLAQIVEELTAALADLVTDEAGPG